ncbi:DUF637 domain-containing protein, partial [Neorhizobium sp. T786]|uniref:HNH/ENDO VII family nuclease n=1 Tax=Pseudorhizobium xiangyangii TaxID=2883104 RepID=UPI001CFF56A0
PGSGVGGILGLAGWQAAAVNAFASSFMLESIDGIVSGNFDLGEILEGAVFAGVTAGLTNAISLDLIGIKAEGLLGKALLGDFGNGTLTLHAILDGALDGLISSGLSSLVYDTDFGSAFSAALIKTVVNLAMADIQFAIGDRYLGEGTPQHMLLHGLVGCAVAQASGGDCAAGAAGAVAQSIYAAYLQNYGGVADEKRALANAEFIGALVGFMFSGGKAENVELAATIARSGLENNYLSHSELALLEAELKECLLQGSDCTQVIAEYRALSEAHDAEFAACGNDTACVQMHMVRIAAAELSGKADEVLLLLKPTGWSATFERLQYETAEKIGGGVNMEEVWTAAGAEFRKEFEKASCSGLSSSTCQVAFDAEVRRLAADAASRAENAQAMLAFFEGIGIVIDFTPGVGDVKAAVECGAALSWGTCLGAAVGMVPALGDGARLLLKKGDDVVEVVVGDGVEAAFRQERKFWSEEPIVFNGNEVYQRNDLFDPNLVTSWRERGMVVTGTNLERMASGRAPIGVDGKSVNLHHLTQTHSGAIAEVTQTFHQTNSKTIHINSNTIPSGIDRPEFDSWRAKYWSDRAANLGG